MHYLILNYSSSIGVMAARNRKTSMSKPCYIPSTPHEVESGAGAGSSQSSHGVGGQVGEANDGDSIPHTRNGILNTGSSAVGIDVMATQPSSSGLVRDVIGIFVVAFDTKEGKEDILAICKGPPNVQVFTFHKRRDQIF